MVFSHFHYPYLFQRKERKDDFDIDIFEIAEIDSKFEKIVKRCIPKSSSFLASTSSSSSTLTTSSSETCKINNNSNSASIKEDDFSSLSVRIQFYDFNEGKASSNVPKLVRKLVDHIQNSLPYLNHLELYLPQREGGAFSSANFLQNALQGIQSFNLTTLKLGDFPLSKAELDNIRDTLILPGN